MFSPRWLIPRIHDQPYHCFVRQTSELQWLLDSKITSVTSRYPRSNIQNMSVLSNETSEVFKLFYQKILFLIYIVLLSFIWMSNFNATFSSRPIANASLVLD